MGHGWVVLFIHVHLCPTRGNFFFFAFSSAVVGKTQKDSAGRRCSRWVRLLTPAHDGPASRQVLPRSAAGSAGYSGSLLRPVLPAGLARHRPSQVVGIVGMGWGKGIPPAAPATSLGCPHPSPCPPHGRPAAVGPSGRP